MADNVDGKTNGAATGLGKEQTEHSGSGNLNQGEVVAEVVAGGRRGRRLALDSADPAGALAMTRAWLAERCAASRIESHTRTSRFVALYRRAGFARCVDGSHLQRRVDEQQGH